MKQPLDTVESENPVYVRRVNQRFQKTAVELANSLSLIH